MRDCLRTFVDRFSCLDTQELLAHRVGDLPRRKGRSQALGDELQLLAQVEHCLPRLGCLQEGG